MGPPRPAKRRRMSESTVLMPMTPLSPEDAFMRKSETQFTRTASIPTLTIGESSNDGDGDQRKSDAAFVTPTAVSAAALADRAARILRIEADALHNITNLYTTDTAAQQSLATAVTEILRTQQRGGKVVVCGVGKSAYIGMKCCATFKSLGVSASFMHGCEAAHGDLGDVRGGRDVLLFVTFSGRTPELLNLLPHISRDVRLMALSSHREVAHCPLLAGRSNSVLLPTPVHEDEQVSFGVCAPTTSTTVTLAVCDMLALTVAEELHGAHRLKDVFGRNHPGGAIGVTYREVEELVKNEVDVGLVELPSPSISAESED